MQDNTPIIEAIDVTKQYGGLMAVDHLNLSVPEGICFGLLGPNGAGKTTLIEIIEDIIPPTTGEIRYKGRKRTGAFREQIGIMFQQTALLAYLTVKETLATFKNLYTNSVDIDELIALCHLSDICNRYSDKISGGQRQRLLLALALINRPSLIFLDEPSTGLDPQARRNLWDIVNNVKAQGKTIILTTHYMEEAHQLCDQLAIVDNGKIIAQGPPNLLISEYGGSSSILLPKECWPLENKVASAFQFEMSNHTVRIQADEINSAVTNLLKAGIDLTHMQVQAPSLEAVFLNLTGRRLRE